MAEPLTGMVSRRLLEVVDARMDEEAVVLLQGPRKVGKSRLLGELAARRGGEVLDLDDLGVRAAADADPTLMAQGRAPVCIDEYQHVPRILDAIKAELNTDLRPGRFVLAGSTRYEALPQAAQSLTGRLHSLNVYPLSQGELAGVTEHFIVDLFDNPQALVTNDLSSETREGYIDRIVRGGLPLALSRATDGSRNRWFDDYVKLTVERDVAELAPLRRSKGQMPELLKVLAGQTARIIDLPDAAGRVGIDRNTADRNVALLEAVFLVSRLPGWGATALAKGKAVAKPKLHVVDSGVAARLLGLTSARLARKDAVALTEFGRLLETFVVGEVRKQVSWLDARAGMWHWRTYAGVEVDVVIERDDGAIAALEVKAGQSVPSKDHGGLEALRRSVGDRFVAGVVLYTGRRSYSAGDRIHVVPIDRLWSA